MQYLAHRLKRLPDTPHRIAIGFSAGVFVSFSPFFGFHFIYAWLVSRLVRGNILAGLTGTFFGNPLTFPFIALFSYRLGEFLLGFKQSTVNPETLKTLFSNGFRGLFSSLGSLIGVSEAQWPLVGKFITDVIWPYFLGGTILGTVAAVIFYFVSYPIIEAYQKRRQIRLEKKQKKHKTRPVYKEG